MDCFPRDNYGVIMAIQCPNCDKVFITPSGDWHPEQEFNGICCGCSKELTYTYGDLIDGRNAR